jgi:hypothetical protein
MAVPEKCYRVAIEIGGDIVENLNSYHDLEKTIALAAEHIKGIRMAHAHIREERYLADVYTNFYGDVFCERELDFFPPTSERPYPTSVWGEYAIA